MRHVRRFMFVAAALLSLPGCVAGRNKPVATVEHRAAPERRSDTAIILLPGFGDDPEEFVSHGFVAAVREAGIDADIIAADAHAGYYFGGTAQERLWADVVVPATRAGYVRIWLVGVSMGGFGALWAAQKEPGPITGIVLFAPFAGRKRALKEIVEVGVAKWQPPLRTGSWDVELWRWLKTAGEPSSTVPPIWLAFGEDDTGRATTLLQQIVPKERVYTRPGGHDWDVWAPLWKTMLPQIPWTAEPAEAAATGFGGQPGAPCGEGEPRRCEGTKNIECVSGRQTATVDCALLCTQSADERGYLHERGECVERDRTTECVCSGPIAPRAVVPMSGTAK